MRLLIIRHAKAEDPEAFAKTGKDDRLRPLTKAGRRRFRRGARGIRRLFPRIDLLATSPLTRAVQTADLLAKVCGERLEFVECAALAPAKRPAMLLEWLRPHAQRDPSCVIALVGHQPHLGRVVSYLVTGSADRARVELKKGAVCVLDFPPTSAAVPLDAGQAALTALLQPRHLRANG